MPFRASFTRAGIFPRMLIAIAPAALLPLTAVIGVSVFLTYSLLTGEALALARQTAEARAAELGADLGAKAAVVRALSYQFSEYREIPAPNRRGRLADTLKSVLRAQALVIAARTTWEPGAIEDDPGEHEGTAFTTPSGGFNSTWYRGERGIVSIPGDDSIYGSDYYLEPKRRLSTTLIAPYRYAYTPDPKDSHLETTICAPILFGGEFKGVVGFDIGLANYQRAVNAIAIFETGYAVLVDASGNRVSHPNVDLIGTRMGDDLPPDEAAEYLNLVARGEPFTYTKKARHTGKDSLILGVPIRAETATPHWVLLLAVPLEEVSRKAVSAARVLAALGLAAALILVAATLLVARGLSRPLAALTRNIEQMAEEGRPGTLACGGTDEIARLSASFNGLSNRLGTTLDRYDATNRELDGLNRELETKVRERTKDLEKAFDELREAQERMMRSEKFAVLGHLSAEIAHELNTPLAAVRSSADFVDRAGAEAWPGLVRFASTAAPAELDAFERLLAEGLDGAAGRAPSSRGARKAFAAALETAGFSADSGLFEDADALGAVPPTEAFLALLRAGRRDAIVLAAAVAGMSRAGAAARMAADKAAATVAALVGYAREDKPEAAEPVDPAAELEELLVIYYGAVKRSVEIVKDFRCRALVRGQRDKLNQVWVNLINNALQAMGGKGRLELRTERERKDGGEFLAVRVVDSGHGIPEDLRDKIFQPLFTTKAKGQGTGLGLDICRKIVERHGGSISFESEPGRTVFKVALPIADGSPERSGS